MIRARRGRTAVARVMLMLVLRAEAGRVTADWEPPGSLAVLIVTWLILPVVICLSQRLSHACLSINASIL